MRWRLPILSLTLVAAMAMPASARGSRAGRNPLATARAELMRIHIRLMRDAESDPAVLQTRDAARRACAAVYQARQNVLATLRDAPEYADLKLALWAKQRQLSGLYDQLPTRVQSIVDSARDAMDVRAKAGAMENAALEADPAYVEARSDATQKLAAQQKAIRDAEDAIRTDAAFIAASVRVQSMQRSITGFTAAVASAR